MRVVAVHTFYTIGSGQKTEVLKFCTSNPRSTDGYIFESEIGPYISIPQIFDYYLCWVGKSGPQFNHFPKISPKNFPKMFPNSSCKSIIKSDLFGAVHTGVLFKNGLGKILGKIFREVIESGPWFWRRCSSSSPFLPKFLPRNLRNILGSRQGY